VEDEFIDKSEQLTPAQVKAYADFQASKGRVEMNNGSILPSRNTKLPIDRLYEDEGILEQHHRDAGVSFKILFDCAYGNVRHNNMRFNGETLDIDPKIKHAAIVYQLTPRQESMVKRILFDRIGENDYGWMRVCKTTLQDSFEALYISMTPDNIKKAIDNRREAARV
jgi:hypothetical protein